MMNLSHTATDLPVRLEQLVNSLDTYARHKYDNFAIFSHDSEILIVAGNYSEHELHTFIQDLRSRASQLLASGESVSMGCGKLTKSIRCLWKSYRQAKSIQKLQENGKIDHSLIFYSDMGIYKLLMGIEDREIIQEYYDKSIRPLLDYDEKNDSDLAVVLRFQKGQSQSVMTAYNMLDGTPCTANPWLLIDKLRNEWGFDGFTIADADAVGIIHKLHHTVNNFSEAGADAINGGLDVIFQTTYDEHRPFLQACLDGLVKEEALDRAVGQVLKAKFHLGLFEHPYIDENEAEKWNACSAHRKLALEVARRSIVLLKNENRVLPLSKQVKRIALIGQDAVQARLGGYSGPGVDKVSILDGLKNRLGDRAIIRYEEGCKRINPEYLTVPTYYLSTLDGLPGLEGRYFNNISYEGVPDLKRIDKRIQFSWTLFAPDSCLAVDWFSVEWNGKLKSPVSGTYRLGLEGNDGYQLTVDGKVLVDKPYKTSFGHTLVPFTFEKGKEYDIRIRFYENTKNARIRFVWDVDTKNEDQSIEQAVQAARESEIAIVVVGIEEGEFRDRGYLALPGRQEELIRRVAATGKTTVVVLIGGSAVVMSEWQDQVPAVLNAWYPGVEGGNAVADVLFGDYNPSGKLPITYPIHEAQLPLNYSHKPTGRSDDYLNLTGEPLFPFGHGLSYSEFDYSGLNVTKAVHGTAFHVTFSVKNTGKYAANEVVHLYLRDQVASVTQPIMRLIHFQPVSLAPRETKELHFTVNEKDLSMLDKELNRVIEPGDFRLMIGRSCKDIRLKTTLTINHPMTLETNH